MKVDESYFYPRLTSGDLEGQHHLSYHCYLSNLSPYSYLLLRLLFFSGSHKLNLAAMTFEVKFELIYPIDSKLE